MARRPLLFRLASPRFDGVGADAGSTRRWRTPPDAVAAPTRERAPRELTARPIADEGRRRLDLDGDALLALDDDDAEDALKTDDGDALDVSFDAPWI